jgi:transcriptional regulator
MTAPINPKHYMTLTEVAYELGISRQRVKQIENVALEKLRKNKKMRSYYEGIFSKSMVSEGGCHSDVFDNHGRRW